MSVSDKRLLPPHINAAVAAVRSIRPWLSGVGLFSALINILMLTGALYMLQLYDRVLTSRSMATLVAISLIALAAFSVQGILDAVRAKMMVRIGARFDELISNHAFDAVTRLALRGAPPGAAVQPVRDVENIRAFLSGLGPTAMFDMPFMPLFLAACFLLHPMLGLLALAGGLVIMVLTFVVDRRTRAAGRETQNRALERQAVVDSARRNAEVITAMGFRAALARRWNAINTGYVDSALRVASTAGTFGSAAKTFLLVLQSAILGLGCYYAILQEISSGAIIAGSILAARALAPIEIAIAHWRGFIAARQSYKRLRETLDQVFVAEPTLALPAPTQHLNVENLIVAAPGQRVPIIEGINFKLVSGTALGILGPSGSGKSTLARALVGVWSPLAGKVRLDGAALDQWRASDFGRYIGYLPQDVELFDGTIAANIARFDPDAPAEAIVAAANMASAHDMIVNLKDGYGTQIGESGAKLSGGQRQRIALARALYGNPFVIVLDEPNSNLDADGEQALSGAIMAARQRGAIVIVITHRASAIGCTDMVAIMRHGRFAEFGPKSVVAGKIIQGLPGQTQPASVAERLKTSNAPPADVSEPEHLRVGS